MIIRFSFIVLVTQGLSLHEPSDLKPEIAYSYSKTVIYSKLSFCKLHFFLGKMFTNKCCAMIFLSCDLVYMFYFSMILFFLLLQNEYVKLFSFIHIVPVNYRDKYRQYIPSPYLHLPRGDVQCTTYMI